MNFWCLIDLPIMRNIMSFRKSQTLSALPPFFDIWREGNHAPNVEYPCEIPSNITPCELIIFTETPLERDFELLSWLKRGRTLFVNLESNSQMDESRAGEIARGLKVFLDRIPDVQVLWKLKASSGFPLTHKRKKSWSSGSRLSGFTGDSFRSISNKIARERVRIVE
jgi:hypothetical protein